MLQIKRATSDELETIRLLFTEYAEWMEYECCFETFDEELSDLPGLYAPPTGELLLAKVDGEPAGSAALKKVGEGLCEMKRLWVRKEFRNQKIGISLIQEILKIATNLSYQKMRLDTAPRMTKAIELYKSLGFETISIGTDVIEMEKRL